MDEEKASNRLMLGNISNDQWPVKLILKKKLQCTLITQYRIEESVDSTKSK